jgi:pimeloyl-ACP methyl ester carboxylesterase
MVRIAGFQQFVSTVCFSSKLGKEEAVDTLTMHKVTSPDGTRISYHRSGAGQPLVLVAGTGAANPRAWPVFPALEQHFTVYAVDRRGHGSSGDSPTYAIDREFEDIAAVVDAIDEPANLLGHSFGGLCALEAALLTQNLRKLILYEGFPNPFPGSPFYPEGFLNRLDDLLDAGDRESILLAHYKEMVGMTPAEIEKFRSSPAWPERVAIAHTVPRELKADEQYRLDASRYKDLHIPTLVLTGSNSPEIMVMGSEIVSNVLPNSRLVMMPGQVHIAMYTAPDLFLEQILAFLGE